MERILDFFGFPKKTKDGKLIHGFWDRTTYGWLWEEDPGDSRS